MWKISITWDINLQIRLLALVCFQRKKEMTNKLCVETIHCIHTRIFSPWCITIKLLLHVELVHGNAGYKELV